MNKIKINNWFVYYNTDKLDSALIHAVKGLSFCVPVKENKKRKIFRILAENGTDYFYLKWHLVNGFKEKVGALFKNKALKEFESCQLLQKYSINVANYFAWGISTDGETMIISEEARDTQTARSYWYNLTMDEFNRPFKSKSEIIEGSRKDANEFILKFKKLIKIFITERIYHPDFHFGNLLWNKTNQDFLVIDPYGIKKKIRFSAKQKFDFIGIIVGLRNYLTNEELVNFCLDINLFDDRNVAQKVIEDYLRKQFSGNKDWAKRFRQILAGREKYNLKLFAKGKKSIDYVRCGFNEMPLETQEKLEDEEFLKIKYNVEIFENIVDAEKIWTNSFICEYQFKFQKKKPIIMKIFDNQAKIYFTKM